MHPAKKTIAFIRAGQKPTATSRTSSSGLLSTAQDWELTVDLGKQLEFPGKVAVTTLRPDMGLISVASKQKSTLSQREEESEVRRAGGAVPLHRVVSEV